MPVSDVFTALEQGVIDGTTLDYELLVSRRMGDQIKYMCQLSTQNTLFYCVMNEAKFNKLPPDLQKVVTDASGAFADKAFSEYWSTIEDSSLKAWVEKMGAKEVTLFSDADYEQCKSSMQPVVDAWFAGLKKHGLPGDEIRTVYYELEQKHGVPWKDFPRYKLFLDLKK
jgi:TRAP-type C4-dicarboxylate transport system substrate-binding protein